VAASAGDIGTVPYIEYDLVLSPVRRTRGLGKAATAHR
jgi:hypothetical protein